MVTESVDNYLKAIYELEEEHGRVSTTALAQKLSIASPSVTAMVKRLNEQDPAMVDYTRHRGVILTASGRKRALEIIRHHRLLETFLVQVLGFQWDEVHDEAQRLEHHISERLEERIAEYLGHPDYDPHGAPIPTKDGRLPKIKYIALSELLPGQRARVLRVKHDDPQVLRYLDVLGIEPGVLVRVESKAPFDGPFHVSVGEEGVQKPHAIGPSVADMVLVDKGQIESPAPGE